MRAGIFTHYIDKYPRSAPSLYQADLIRKLIERTNLEIVLIHHEKTNSPLYKLTEKAVVSKLPYLREREINKLDLDLIHFNAIPWSWWPSITKLNIPIIATVHGTIHWDNPRLDDYTPFILRTLKKTLERKVAEHITYFIAISNHVSKVLTNKLKVPRSKIEVVYLPIDHSMFESLDGKNTDEVRRKYGIGLKYILHVSSFSKRKNPKTLFKAFYEVKRRIKNIMLVIAGSKWNNPLVLELIKRYNLQNSVKILGWVPKEDLISLYKGAELFLFPSLHENFGFPLVEAMASGTPIVSSNVFAIPEVCGNATILCDPDDHKCFSDAIFKLLTDKELREEMIIRGFKRAKLFDWNKHIDRVMNIYKKIISKIGDRVS